MVIQAIFDFGIWLFELIASAMPSAQPVMYNIASSLNDVLGFGVWVIGHDMWIFFVSTVSAWLTFKIGWGIVLFIYKLIPLI